MNKPLLKVVEGICLFIIIFLLIVWFFVWGCMITNDKSDACFNEYQEKNEVSANCWVEKKKEVSYCLNKIKNKFLEWLKQSQK